MNSVEIASLRATAKFIYFPKICNLSNTCTRYDTIECRFSYGQTGSAFNVPYTAMNDVVY